VLAADTGGQRGFYCPVGGYGPEIDAAPFPISDRQPVPRARRPPVRATRMHDVAISSDEIFVVDDDKFVHDTLSALLGQVGFRVTSFFDGSSFLEAALARTPACVILDMYMPGETGLDLLEKLDAKNYPAPILMFTGRGDIPSAVAAIRNGAFDFVEKQFDGTIGKRVREAVDAWAHKRQNGGGSDPPLQDSPGYDRLTRRERDVLAQITTAATNREAAANLGISRRTVEVHRRHIMQKLGARNTVDLVHIILKARHA
jgi:two-component system, LuxR family, response regulator FixJ